MVIAFLFFGDGEAFQAFFELGFRDGAAFGEDGFDGDALAAPAFFVFADDAEGIVFRGQMIGGFQDREAEGRQVGEACLIKLLVIGFEVKFAFFFQKALILQELAGVGEPALVVFFLGPGVAEINEETAYALPGKKPVDAVDVVPQEAGVAEFAFFNAALGGDHGVGFQIDAEKIDVRMCVGDFVKKAAFAAAEFQIEGLIGAVEPGGPAAFPFLSVKAAVRTFFHFGNGPGFSS